MQRGGKGARRWWAEKTSHAVACTTRAGVGGTVSFFLSSLGFQRPNRFLSFVFFSPLSICLSHTHNYENTCTHNDTTFWYQHTCLETRRTARSVEDETRNAELFGNRNPE